MTIIASTDDRSALQVAVAAAEAAEAVGFDGTSPYPICGLLFALADVLGEAGYDTADIAMMYGKVTDRLHQFAAERTDAH